MCTGGDQPADHIKDDEATGPHTVLDVVAEHPEEQGISEEVPPAPVEKHRDDGRECVDRFAVDHAADPISDANSSPDREPVRELGWYHPEITDALDQLELVAWH